MIFDKTGMFSEDQAVTATAASTNTIDLGAARTMKGGTDIPIAIVVTESFDKLTSLTVSVETDDNEAFPSPKTVYTSGAIPLADLALGGDLKPPFRLPWNVAERYVRLKYTVTGTSPDNGKITAGVVAALQTA